jgi:drug/metabolite transporter (DMT)-like permease
LDESNATSALVVVALGENVVDLKVCAGDKLSDLGSGMDRAEESGDGAWVLLVRARPSVLLLLAACAVRRPGLPSPPAVFAAIAAIGVFDLLANLLFVLATGRGLLSVVGVLAALYPTVTVLLARVVLHERLTRAQDAGVLVTLAGVVALAAGA